MTPRRSHVYRYVPGDGLYGRIPHDGELCTALRPCADALGDWIVRWASDGTQGRVCVLDLRDAETPAFDFGCPA